MSKNILVLLGVVLLLGFGWWWFHKSASDDQGTTSEISASEINADLYPLYEAAGWGEVEVEEVTVGDVILQGHSVTSESIAVESDLSEVFIPFMTHYKTTLEAAGWEMVPNLDAGGPTGGQSGYEKDGGVILVSYHVDFHVENENAPSGCPCDVTFSLFSAVAEQLTDDNPVVLGDSSVLALFDEHMIGECIADGREGEYQSCEIDITEDGDSYRARVTFDGLSDDSVQAIRYEGVVARDGDSWLLNGEVSETYLCQANRGQQDFAPDLCL